MPEKDELEVGLESHAGFDFFFKSLRFKYMFLFCFQNPPTQTPVVNKCDFSIDFYGKIPQRVASLLPPPPSM